MLQKEDVNGYNSYVDHSVQFSHLMGHIQQLTRQLAAELNSHIELGLT